MSFEELKNICRGCLATERKMVSATLYEAEFKDLTGITISPTDGLPQWLCYECIALLRKSVRFGNKVMRSHIILCMYVLEGVPFTCNNNGNPHLIQTSILHNDICGTLSSETAQTEEAIKNSLLCDNYNLISDNREVDPLLIDESNIKKELNSDENVNMHDVSESPSCNVAKLETSNMCLVTLNHEELTGQREVTERISPVEEEIDLDMDIIKYESSSDNEENIPVQDWSIDQSTVLKSKSTIHETNSDEQTEKERDSARKGQQLFKHTHTTFTPKREVEENDKCKANSNSRVNKSSKNKMYECDVCLRHFYTPDTLKVHYRIHSGEKPYKCDVCMKCFTFERLLVKHSRIHIDCPFMCYICKQCFTNSSRLLTHIRKHENPYKCNVCMKCFSTPDGLNSHSCIPNGNKPHKCDVCMRYFFTSDSLKSHYRLHSGEKPYKCDKCMKRYVFEKQLKRHHCLLK